MKSVAALSILLLPLFGFSQTTGAEWAKGELSKAEATLAQTRAKISQERGEISRELAAERALTAELSAKLKKLSSEGVSDLGLLEKSKYNDLIASEIYADASAFASSSGVAEIPSRFSAGFSEADSAARKVLDFAYEDLFEPLKLRAVEVVALVDGAKLKGDSFRVGGLRYFVGEGRAGYLSSDNRLYGENRAEEIKRFFSDKSNELPADISRGFIFQSERNKTGFWEEISLGGIWMYPILFFGALSAVVLVVKSISFVRIRRLPSSAIGSLYEAIEAGSPQAVAALSTKLGYPYSKLLESLSAARNLPSAKLEEISYEAMLSAGERLFSGLSILSVTAAVAPLFGLLGTVTGIIKIFGDLSFQGADKAQFISAGISEALITTEYGLVVAIPAFVVHALFSRRAKAILSDMEKLASGFVGRN